MSAAAFKLSSRVALLSAAERMNSRTFVAPASTNILRAYQVALSGSSLAIGSTRTSASWLSIRSSKLATNWGGRSPPPMMKRVPSPFGSSGIQVSVVALFSSGDGCAAGAVHPIHPQKRKRSAVKQGDFCMCSIIPTTSAPACWAGEWGRSGSISVRIAGTSSGAVFHRSDWRRSPRREWALSPDTPCGASQPTAQPW